MRFAARRKRRSWAAGLVVVTYLLLLGCHIAYQKILGRLVIAAGSRLSREMELSATADAKEGTTAFLEKRKPVFRGA